MAKKRLLSAFAAFALACGLLTPSFAAPTSLADTTSQQYVEAMGHGWNLGNSFDGFNSDEGAISDETSWGNPVVTRELIRSIKTKGFDSIRIPLTLSTRYEEADGKCVIDADWLARYKEVVDWAVDEGLYVMVNIHHDSWIWLSGWDGDLGSAEYVRFIQLWEQLADYLKDEPAQVCFETINEPQFNEGSDKEKQEKLDKINLAAYQVIRKSGGNNASRMIVMPTLNTNHGNCAPLLELIQGLDDKNIIATVHYYSEWVYSANLGITGFDEALGDDGNTPRKAADNAMSTVYEAFTKNGIGVVVGEYGVLGYDKSERCNQPGEELKYYEYMGELSRKYGICLMFWDNGSGINRRSDALTWKKPLAGAMLEASAKGRSSYSEGLDTLYFSEKVEQDVIIPLTLNGNTFQDIAGLKEEVDYTYDSQTAAVTLKADYINGLIDAKEGFGAMADLTLRFSSGADWHETLVKFGAPEFGEAVGTTAEGLSIPVQYHGAEVRRVTAYSGEEKTGPHSSWWKYLEHSYAFMVEDNALTLTDHFFEECAEGEIRLVIEFYDGQTAQVWLTRNGSAVSTGRASDAALSAFHDLVLGSGYEDAVRYVLSHGIMRGTSGTTFAPDQTLTYAQLCQIIYNMAGASEMLGGTTWYTAAMVWCQENGITLGSAEAAPNAAVSREEAAGFLYRYAAYLGKETQEGSVGAFTDADSITPELLPAVSWAVGKGILTGQTQTALEPDGSLTRAEIAEMVMRFGKNA